MPLALILKISAFCADDTACDAAMPLFRRRVILRQTAYAAVTFSLSAIDSLSFRFSSFMPSFSLPPIFDSPCQSAASLCCHTIDADIDSSSRRRLSSFLFARRRLSHAETLRPSLFFIISPLNDYSIFVLLRLIFSCYATFSATISD